MRLVHKVVLASLNRDKLEEFRSILRDYPDVDLVPAEGLIRNARGLGFAEKYETYLENASAKARMANQASHYPSLADDSGIEVSFLNGLPGVKSHRFAPPAAGKTQDQANIDLLLSKLGSTENRTAKFVCTVALLIEGILVHAKGELEGTLTKTPRGTQGFGYDSIFIPQGETRTLAEMSSDEKNAISHRAKAIRELMAQVKSYQIIFAKP